MVSTVVIALTAFTPLKTSEFVVKALEVFGISSLLVWALIAMDILGIGSHLFLILLTSAALWYFVFIFRWGLSQGKLQGAIVLGKGIPRQKRSSGSVKVPSGVVSKEPEALPVFRYLSKGVLIIRHSSLVFIRWESLGPVTFGEIRYSDEEPDGAELLE